MKFKKIAWWLFVNKLPIRINHPFWGGVEIAIWDCAPRGERGKELTLLQLFKEIRITARSKSTDDLYKVYKKGIYK